MGTVTLGQNLKRIRKELELNQDEIVGQEITRNLISMIENDKSPMSYKIAKIVADNMNVALSKKGVEVYVAPDDIMNPERVEAKGQANKYIRELRKRLDKKEYNLSPTYIEKLTKFLNNWSIPEKKVEIYELLGDMSYFNRDIKWEYLYLNKALENYFITPVKREVYVLGRKLIASCIDNERYDEALALSNLDIMNSNKIPKDFKATIYFNKALAYRKLKDYEKTLEILNEYEKFIEKNNINKLRQTLLLKAICYSKKNKKDKAINEYKKIIEIFGEDCIEAGLAYSNIISLYKELGLKEQAIEYRDKLIKILSNLQQKNNRYLLNIYKTLAEINEYTGDIDLAEYYYISTINKAIDIKNNNMSADMLYKLLCLYNKTNQQQKILLSNNIFKRGFENINLSNEAKLAFSLVLTNMKLGEEEIANGIITDILKKEDNGNED